MSMICSLMMTAAILSKELEMTVCFLVSPVIPKTCALWVIPISSNISCSYINSNNKHMVRVIEATARPHLHLSA